MSRKKQPEEFAEHDAYLWDGSGKPSPEVQLVENALSRFRHSGAVPTFPEYVPAKTSRLRMVWFGTPWLPRFAAVAVIFLAAIVGSVLLLFPRTARTPGGGWDIVRLAGSPQIGSKVIGGESAKAKLEVGQVLATNSVSRATIEDAATGEIEVEPDSRVRLVRSDSSRKLIALELGTIHAAIWAPPGNFVVDTPSAVAVDLGCAYTLHVAPDGSGILRTTLGWVGFHLHDRDSFIPAGAMCLTRPKIGPGTPYFEDATEQFRSALAQFDFGPQTTESRDLALHTILAQARPKDALTLWHLLSRTDGVERAQVYERFASLVPPPAGVTREGILRLDQKMLDSWWNALGFGDISIWRYWEQSSSPSPQNSSASHYLQKKEELLQKHR
jgi:hypothetical protein